MDRALRGVHNLETGARVPGRILFESPYFFARPSAQCRRPAVYRHVRRCRSTSSPSSNVATRPRHGTTTRPQRARAHLVQEASAWDTSQLLAFTRRLVPMMRAEDVRRATKYWSSGGFCKSKRCWSSISAAPTRATTSGSLHVPVLTKLLAARTRASASGARAHLRRHRRRERPGRHAASAAKIYCGRDRCADGTL